MEKRVKFGDNVFDLLRLYAVMQVTIGHCSSHLQVTLPESLKMVFGYPGAVILFVISGFLVTASWDRQVGGYLAEKTYLKKRACRIFPGLWCCVSINMALIFMIYNVKPSLIETVVYFVTQFLGANFYTGDWLRGYGVGAPNGSLWTICVELQFYLFVLFFWKKLKKWGGGTMDNMDTVLVLC